MSELEGARRPPRYPQAGTQVGDHELVRGDGWKATELVSVRELMHESGASVSEHLC